jgi:hypothetical protein
MSAWGLGRVKTRSPLGGAERSSTGMATVTASVRVNARIEVAAETRFPSVDSISEFSRSLGHTR